jgi:cytoskeletal protein RodZ
MSTVAEQLRSAREAKNLTVEQLAELTKMRTDHIRALEEGDFEVFSAPIYIRGSVKNYAGALKINAAPLLAELDKELGRTKNFSEPPPLTDQKKSIVDQFALIVAKVNWKLGVAGVGIVLLAIIIGLTVMGWKQHQKNDPLKNLPPAVYSPANAGDTLPLPKK